MYRELQRCLDRVLADVASGRGTQRAAATCAGRLDPAAAASVLARARIKATERFTKRCQNLTPADLDRPCDPAATTMNQVVTCVLDRHVASAEELIARSYGSACAILRSIGLDGARPRVCL